jgi:hypothetical protein
VAVVDQGVAQRRGEVRRALGRENTRNPREVVTDRTSRKTGSRPAAA